MYLAIGFLVSIEAWILIIGAVKIGYRNFRRWFENPVTTVVFPECFASPALLFDFIVVDT
jgi:hypothetical protein